MDDGVQQLQSASTKRTKENDRREEKEKINDEERRRTKQRRVASRAGRSLYGVYRVRIPI